MGVSSLGFELLAIVLPRLMERWSDVLLWVLLSKAALLVVRYWELLDSMSGPVLAGQLQLQRFRKRQCPRSMCNL